MYNLYDTKINNYLYFYKYLKFKLLTYEITCLVKLLIQICKQIMTNVIKNNIGVEVVHNKDNEK